MLLWEVKFIVVMVVEIGVIVYWVGFNVYLVVDILCEVVVLII